MEPVLLMGLAVPRWLSTVVDLILLIDDVSGNTLSLSAQLEETIIPFASNTLTFCRRIFSIVGCNVVLVDVTQSLAAFTVFGK